MRGEKQNELWVISSLCSCFFYSYILKKGHNRHEVGFHGAQERQLKPIVSPVRQRDKWISVHFTNSQMMKLAIIASARAAAGKKNIRSPSSSQTPCSLSPLPLSSAERAADCFLTSEGRERRDAPLKSLSTADRLGSAAAIVTQGAFERRVLLAAYSKLKGWWRVDEEWSRHGNTTRQWSEKVALS